jgi:hypothetical protein
MTLAPLFFILAALLLLGLLAYAARPIETRALSPDSVFEALLEPRHSFRLPQILQSLQPSDTEFLERRGLRSLRQRIRSERTQIAIRYLNQLESDYETLLEASRILAVMSPEIVAMQEFERLRLSVRFAQNCFLMRLRLRAGFAPWKGFATISDMATTMSFRMESATLQIALQSALATDSASFMEERGGGGS